MAEPFVRAIPESRALPWLRSSPSGVLVVGTMLALAGLDIWYPTATVPFLLDALLAMLLLLPAAVAGVGVLSLFRPEPLPPRWWVIGGAALGTGALSLFTLLMGMMGWLNRPAFLLLNFGFLAFGLASLRRAIAAWFMGRRRARTNAVRSDPLNWLWLLAVPFAVMSAAAASTAPGFLWEEEGFGYDVLEYHLQVPKEYRQNGRIDYLPHNVYASFPSNVEMLYLHAMILLDEDVDAGTIAHATHWLLGVLFVCAGWCVASDGSSRAGTVAGILLATTGWLSYLSGLAYVEQGLLLYGMLAVGATIRALGNRVDDSTQAGSNSNAADSSASTTNRSGGWASLAGVFAGLACGCKYTAVAFVAAPLLIVFLVATHGSWRIRLGKATWFSLMCVAVFGPWAGRNIIHTGNPVFPLLSSMFPSSPEGWGPDEAARWDRGHRPRESESSVSARVRQLWHHVVWERRHRIGPVLFIMALAALIVRKWTRIEVCLVLLFFMQLVVWLAVTHLYARFAVVFLIPLALLAGRLFVNRGYKPGGSTHPIFRVADHKSEPRPSEQSRDREGADPLNPNYRLCSSTGTSIAVAALVAAAGWNGFHVARLHAQEHVRTLVDLPASAYHEGHVQGYKYLGAVNALQGGATRVLLVGEARAFYFRSPVDYTVVFNRSPFLDVVRTAQSPQEVVRWLRRRSYTHILVHWGEIERLRTYGFAEQTTTALLSLFEGSGLTLVERFPHPRTSAPYVELYEIIGS